MVRSDTRAARGALDRPFNTRRFGILLATLVLDEFNGRQQKTGPLPVIIALARHQRRQTRHVLNRQIIRSPRIIGQDSNRARTP